MVCRIDLDKCFEENLTPTQFALLYCLHANNKFPWPVPLSQWKALEDVGWVKITAEAVELRDKVIDFICQTSAPTDNVDSWIEEWRNLWPTGVKSGGRPVRGDKRGCLAKMNKFIKEHDYTKEEIMEATKIYLFEKRRESYKYVTCADYFILKNTSSILASFCEDIHERDNSLKQTEDGNSKFFKSV